MHIDQPFFLASGQKKLKVKKLKNSKTQGKKLKLKPKNQFFGKIWQKMSMNWLEIGKTEIQSPKFTIEIQDFPYKLNKFWENSRILIKLKQKNSISGISETVQYPESGQKKGWHRHT